MNARDDDAQGQRDFSADASEYNRLRFFVESALRDALNTAALVRVDACSAPGPSGAAGTVSATPLVAQTDAQGNALPMASIPRLPFLRYQAGRAAVILDPVPGDQGVAVFFKNDSSAVGPGTSEPRPPGSWRHFSQSDGAYLPGVQNAPPTVWIQLTQDERVIVHAPGGVAVESDGPCRVTANEVSVRAEGDVALEAGTAVSLSAPVIRLNGALESRSRDGGPVRADVYGTLNATDDLTAAGVSLASHAHGGVDAGPDLSGPPETSSAQGA